MTQIFFTCLIFFILTCPRLFSCPSEDEKTPPLKIIFEHLKSAKALQNCVDECLEDYPKKSLILVQIEGILTDDPTPNMNFETYFLSYPLLKTYTLAKIPPKPRRAGQTTMIEYLKGLIEDNIPIIFMSHLLKPADSIYILKYFGLLPLMSPTTEISLKDPTEKIVLHYGMNGRFVWGKPQHLQGLYPSDYNFYYHAVVSPFLFFPTNCDWDQIIIINHNYQAPHLGESLEALAKVTYSKKLKQVALLELDSFIGRLRKET